MNLRVRNKATFSLCISALSLPLGSQRSLYSIDSTSITSNLCEKIQKRVRKGEREAEEEGGRRRREEGEGGMERLTCLV